MNQQHPSGDVAALDAWAADAATEGADRRYAELDRMSTADLAALINDADATVPAAVRRALPQIVVAVDGIAERLAGGGRLLYVGAGTSGRLGVLDASECPPTYGTAPEQVTAIIAGGPAAILAAQEGAEDDEAGGAAAIDLAAVGPADAVVGIAASGRTPFVVAAVERAGALGALTIGLSCNSPARLSESCAVAIEVEVGPEVVAGSTRMKAGTATKLVLNMLSTMTMVRLGKTYGNLMVEVAPTNEKLRRRAVRIVTAITGAAPEVAAAALAASGHDVKTASVMVAAGVDVAAARARLAAHGGHLRPALAGGQQR